MALTEQYCRERADEARAAATGADLANVVERNLRAAAAWDVMASRARRTTTGRAEIAARKAAAAEEAQDLDEPMLAANVVVPA